MLPCDIKCVYHSSGFDNMEHMQALSNPVDLFNSIISPSSEVAADSFVTLVSIKLLQV